MLSIIRKNWIFAVALIMGLYGIASLISVRVAMESQHTGVSLIMSQDDVEILAILSDTDYDSYAQALTDAGLTSIFTPSEVDESLSLFIGETYSGEDATIGMLEDNNQFSHNPIDGFEYDESADVVRVFKLIPEYAARYEYLGYSGPEEIENLTYRTITDRNIRVIWLCPFLHAETKEVVYDVADYVSVIEGVGSRIESQGLHLGQFSTLEGHTPNTLSVVLVMFFTMAVAVLLLSTVIALPKRLDLILLVLGTWVCCGTWNFAHWLAPLLTSIVFPCAGIYLVALMLDKADFSKRNTAILSYLKILLVAFAVAIIGGLAIGAMQSSRAYMLAVENFRGVKISQTVPILYSIFICYKTFYKGKNPIEIAKSYRNTSRVFYLAVAVLAVVAVVYIARTADGLFSAGMYEQRFRNWLENLLLVRPRTKEFLFAWPCLALAISLFSLGSVRYAVPFAIFTATGLASIVNTFCHSRSPIWLSFSRSGMGLILGAICGVIVIYLAFWLKNSKKIK